ncbi:pro-FMRFamide-related neuropeptide VF [Echinops telfairi]|uniref:Pro-FMRFamide-related neuropeptide VF n=1 Tax=Echinops telfairi TaxID=9371 RepID=A0ABM0ILG3_ECHTE|nr:pro-FMRFamide-related neuropeptide VF [Echinops telfairi]
MEMIASTRFVVLALATASLLASSIFCADDFAMHHLHSRENADKRAEHRGNPKGDREGSFHLEELKDWDPKGIPKMSLPAVNRIPHAAANLPLRFGRAMEGGGVGPMTTLPLRFGRNMKGSILRRVPNLPQRFGRTVAVKSVTGTLSDLIQQSMTSPSVDFLYSMSCLPQEFQNPDLRKHPRKPVFKKIDDAELKQEK